MAQRVPGVLEGRLLPLLDLGERLGGLATAVLRVAVLHWLLRPLLEVQAMRPAVL